MRSDSYVVDVLDQLWVLHVFDVQGEEDILSVPLRIGSRGEYEIFQDSFKAALVARCPFHRDAAKCPSCRPADREVWLSKFTDWVKDAYSAMPFPPSPVMDEDLPEVVRLSMGCVYRQDDGPESSSIN
jgi:hypothetical protein